MTSTEMLRAGPLKPGYWFENVAPLGETPTWQVKLAPAPETKLLFGYQPDDLLAKQHRRAA